MSVYAIRVDGHLDDHWSSWFGGLTLTRHRDGTSTLTGPFADQAHLHGALNRLRDIGATLLDVHATAVRPVLAGPLHAGPLTLRPARADDAEATWRIRQLDSVHEWLTDGPADLAGYRDQFTDPARLATTVIVHFGATVIGDLRLRREESWAELGCAFDPDYDGYEAVRAILRHCFDDLGLHRITARCLLDDTASGRLMERAGLRREGHAIRAHQHPTGHYVDTVTYALLADEYPPA